MEYTKDLNHAWIFVIFYFNFSIFSDLQKIFSSLSGEHDPPQEDKKKGQKKAKKSNKSKAGQRKNNKKSHEQQSGNDLSTKIFATMEKHKEVFFVIRLHSAQTAATLAVS